jgi:hypothetical protein
MRRPISTVLAAAVTIGAGLPAAGQESPKQEWFQPGGHELSLGGSLTSYGDNDFLLHLAGDFGYMLTSRHEVGLSLNLQFWISDVEKDVWGSCGFLYRYNVPIRISHLIPFAGVRVVWPFGLVWPYGDEQQWDAEVLAEAGFRFVVGPSISLNLMGYYGRILGYQCGWMGCPADPSGFGYAIGMSGFF